MAMLSTILAAYGISEPFTATVFGSGLINRTWKVSAAGKEYILQQLNDQVFKNPSAVADNIRLIADHLQHHHPDYLFAAPIQTLQREEMFREGNDGYYRLFPFIRQSHTIDVAEKPEEAYEAAVQFGRFTRMLSSLDAGRLHTTIPGFHDLDLRYRQFLQATKEGDPDRITAATALIRSIMDQSEIVRIYQALRSNPSFRRRVMHHDTKISNVLFNSEGKGLCVIDLDTVMPGYFISDLGDMMRTYLSPVGEEEKDFSAITVRPQFYSAIVQGYETEMKEELTPEEKQYFFYSGRFMSYMQALRFLTDHLQGDKYYGARYPGHNLVRAGNQFTLLQQLNNKKAELEQLVKS
jgi:aminoglycoside phosphotransferase (APT) family kinase protein